MSFISENLSTIIITLIIAVIFFSIIVKGIKNRKNGKHSCGCGCNGCAASEFCHKKEE